MTRLFTTLADGQRKAILSFYLREGRGEPWQPVGRIEWEDLPPSPAGEPTLELALIPGNAGNLLLRLRERSSGAARSYRLRLPGARWTMAPAGPEPAAPEPAAPAAAAPLPAASESTAVRSRHHPARRRARAAIAAALAVGALAAGAVLALRYTSLLETLALGKPMLTPEKSPSEYSGPADGGSAASPREPEEPVPVKASSAAQPPAGQPPEALSYRVQWGDTLWRITQQYYGDPYLYSLLAGENAIVDPDLIIPGTELRLPPRIDEQDRKR